MCDSYQESPNIQSLICTFENIDSITSLVKNRQRATIYCVDWSCGISVKTINDAKYVTFHVVCEVDQEFHTNWSVRSYGTLSILNYKLPYKPMEFDHMFCSTSREWNRMQIIRFKDLENNQLCVRLDIRSDMPYNYTKYVSKRETGYAGLINEGSTCYINSVIQSLYFICSFRKSVYSMRIDSSLPKSRVSLAVQRLFYLLQYTDGPVSTTKLTESFGWNASDATVQHDSQEFCRVLLDKIEDNMKELSMENHVTALFEGKMLSYIKCCNVDYESSRTESFYDIQLNVRGFGDIYESFDDYVSTTLLNGNNKYNTEQWGLQDARKGVIFESLPPVLHIHLLRVIFDPYRFSNVKVNDHFKFYRTINLDPYLQSPSTSPAIYVLQSVVVHIGDPSFGHYIVYASPQCNHQWLKFDDETVCWCDEADAIDGNFGVKRTSRWNSTAYMLVYVRASEIDNVVCSVDKTFLYDQSLTMFDEEIYGNSCEMNGTLSVKITTESSFIENIGPNLVDASFSHSLITVPCDATVQDLTLTVAHLMKFDPYCIRLWPVFMDFPFVDDFNYSLTCSMGDLLTYKVSKVGLNYFVEIKSPDQFNEFIPNENRCIFVKYFEEDIKYAGFCVVRADNTFAQLTERLAVKIGQFVDTDQLDLYTLEEIIGSYVDFSTKMKSSLTNLRNGQILVLTPRTASINLYYLDYMDGVDIRASLFPFYDTPTSQVLKFSIKKTSPSTMIRSRMCELLGVEDDSLQIYFHSNLVTLTDSELSKVFSLNVSGRGLLFFNYRVVSSDELRQTVMVVVIWRKSDSTQCTFMRVAGLGETVADVLKGIVESSDHLKDSNVNNLRFVAQNGYICTAIRMTEKINSIPRTDRYYYCDELPSPDDFDDKQSFLLSCLIISKEPQISQHMPTQTIHLEVLKTMMKRVDFYVFGIPFLFKVKLNESYRKVRENICKILPDFFSNYNIKLGMVTGMKMRYLPDLYVFDSHVDIFSKKDGLNRYWFAVEFCTVQTKTPEVGIKFF